MRIRSLLGFALAGMMLLGASSQAKAQFSLSLGNPYGGGVVIGNNPYGYGMGAPVYSGYSGYSSGYGGYVAPGMTTYYNSGYSGYAPVYVAPRIGYPGYGYGVVAPRYYRAPVYPYVYRGYGRRFNRW